MSSKLISTFQHAGLRCRVLFVQDSHHCGYVSVPSSHPLYGKGYYAPDVSVHGGLTYAEPTSQLLPGADGWDFGFDCAHSGDQTKLWPVHGVFRDQAYVEAECRSLADQLAALAPPPFKSVRGAK
jgi:hypothetical protein